MSPAAALDDMRRVIARLGASTTAHRLVVPPPTAGAMRPREPATPVRAVAPAAAGVPTHGPRPLATAVHDARPRTAAHAGALGGAPAHVQVRAAGGLLRARARRLTATNTAGVHPRARRLAAPAPAPTSCHRAVDLPALWRLRRRPIPWERMERKRLRAAWEGLLDDHRVDGGDIELVGIYGAVPLVAIGRARVDDRRILTATMTPGDEPADTGDLAVARHMRTGALLHTGIHGGHRDRSGSDAMPDPGHDAPSGG